MRNHPKRFFFAILGVIATSALVGCGEDSAQGLGNADEVARQASSTAAAQESSPQRMAEAAKRDPAVQAVRRDLDGERITKLEAKAAHFDLALDNLLHHATVRPAGSPKQVRDMICDAVTDANRGVNSETRMRREP